MFIADLVSTLPRPIKELKGFASTKLESGAKGRVEIKLDKWALGYWNEDGEGQWIAEAGEFEILVGGGPHSFPLRAVVALQQSLSWRGA